MTTQLFSAFRQHFAATEHHRDLYFFCLYRVFEATLLAAFLFGLIDSHTPGYPTWAKAIALCYLTASILLLYQSFHTNQYSVHYQVLVGVLTDIFITVIASHVLHDLLPSVFLMLLFNIAATALLLPLRYSLGTAALAASVIISHFFLPGSPGDHRGQVLLEHLMFAASFLMVVVLVHLLNKKLQQSQIIVTQRTTEASNLSDLNEIIIRQMHSGVILVDANNIIRLTNELAATQLGSVQQQQHLNTVSPNLAQRLQQWRQNKRIDDSSLHIPGSQTDVLPRFIHLHAHNDDVLIFLDDATLASRHAQAMTLTSLGQFSASLAHEIRNPLAAISYATQLLQESTDRTNEEQHLLDIIYRQSKRANAVIENVLGLARRDPARAEQINLVSAVHQAINNYRETQPSDSKTVMQVTSDTESIITVIDPSHLQQILMTLLHNAMTHGHQPGLATQLTIRIYLQNNRPIIDVIDCGPGIEQRHLAQLFQPFFTTTGEGTGLGLYIARELSHANDSQLQYLPASGNGSCFRITLPPLHALMAQQNQCTDHPANHKTHQPRTA